jgi:hypothetical protein
MNKSYRDRVVESVRVLKQMRDYGITEEISGYIELKGEIDRYIKTGESWMGKIAFPEIGRVAHISLPKRASHTIEVSLKVR